MLAAIGTLRDNARPVLDWLGIAQVPWVPWALIALLLLSGLWLLGRGLSRKSRLLQPERLLIDPDNPDHLRGRVTEVGRLRDAVTARPLVLLEGESGCGKSALVRSGLIPALRDPAPDAVPAQVLLPIYINSYGDDWDQDLRDRLLGATWTALGPDLRERLGIASQDALRKVLLPSGKSSVFRRIRTELGIIPLIVFDQFDDYQVAHRGQFLIEGSWIDADRLIASNTAWRRIRDELGHDAFHLLFVTRRDLFAGTEAVRFDKPLPLTLDRIEPTYIAALLDALTLPGDDGKPVVADPDAGWGALKDRLIRDLSARGAYCPSRPGWSSAG